MTPVAMGNLCSKSYAKGVLDVELVIRYNLVAEAQAYFPGTTPHANAATIVADVCRHFIFSSCFNATAQCTPTVFQKHLDALRPAFVALYTIPSPIALSRECGIMLKHAANPTSAAAMTACNAFAATTGAMKCNSASPPAIIRVCQVYVASACGKTPSTCTAVQASRYTTPIISAFVPK
jgi:hypothetical protein